jgi:hypothetical protein
MTGVLRAMLRATDDDVVIINGALGFGERWRDLLMACTVRAMRHRPGFVVSDATWEQRSGRDESTAPVLHRVNGTFSRFLGSTASQPPHRVVFSVPRRS